MSLSAAARAGLDEVVPDLGATLGEALLTPTRIYARDCLALAAAGGVRTFAHVTGGGLAANLARVIPPGLLATVERGTWTRPPIFDYVAARGGVSSDAVEATFNLGVGMVAVVAPEAAAAAVALLAERGLPAWVAGDVVAEPAADDAGWAGEPGPAGAGRARLVGQHAG